MELKDFFVSVFQGPIALIGVGIFVRIGFYMADEGIAALSEVFEKPKKKKDR